MFVYYEKEGAAVRAFQALNATSESGFDFFEDDVESVWILVLSYNRLIAHLCYDWVLYTDQLEVSTSRQDMVDLSLFLIESLNQKPSSKDHDFSVSFKGKSYTLPCFNEECRIKGLNLVNVPIEINMDSFDIKSMA
jgi:hypothetical protein